MHTISQHKQHSEAEVYLWDKVRRSLLNHGILKPDEGFILPKEPRLASEATNCLKTRGCSWLKVQ